MSFIVVEIVPGKIPKFIGFYRKYNFGVDLLTQEKYTPNYEGPKDERGPREFIKGKKRAYVCPF